VGSYQSFWGRREAGIRNYTSIKTGIKVDNHGDKNTQKGPAYPQLPKKLQKNSVLVYNCDYQKSNTRFPPLHPQHYFELF
jgi:hypothetical protein